MILTGDIVCDHVPGFIRHMIRRVLSRSGRVPFTTHNGAVYEISRRPFVLNAFPPRARRDDLTQYLERIRLSGGQYVVIRPVALELLRLEGASGMISEYEREHVRLCLEGEYQHYPKLDIYLLWKRYSLHPAVRWLLPFVRTPRAHMYCTERVAHMACANPVLSWCPKELASDMPTPLCVEDAIRAGAVVLVDEHPAGLFDRIKRHAV